MVSTSYLFNGCCPDDQGPPHCVLHLLDAGVHVVQGHSSWGGHLFRSWRETAASWQNLLSETQHIETALDTLLLLRGNLNQKLKCTQKLCCPWFELEPNHNIHMTYIDTHFSQLILMVAGLGKDWERTTLHWTAAGSSAVEGEFRLKVDCVFAWKCLRWLI